MALIKCKECSAAVAENAESCPSCGFVFARSKAKGRFEMFGTISGPLILSAAGTLLAYITFVHQARISPFMRVLCERLRRSLPRTRIWKKIHNSCLIVSLEILRTSICGTP
jgi:Uncharacterised protein family UPF0547